MTKPLTRRNAARALAMAALVSMSSAHAQLNDVLKGASSSGAGSAAGVLAPSMGGMSMGNVAGILQYCVKNSFIGATQAGKITDQLVTKLGGPSKAASDKDYQMGEKGVVQTGDGKQVDLGGASGGSKSELAKSVCSTALNQAKKFL